MIEVVRYVLIEQSPPIPAIACRFAIFDVFSILIAVESEQMPEIPRFSENCVER